MLSAGVLQYQDLTYNPTVFTHISKRRLLLVHHRLTGTAMLTLVYEVYVLYKYIIKYMY